LQVGRFASGCGRAKLNSARVYSPLLPSAEIQFPYVFSPVSFWSDATNSQAALISRLRDADDPVALTTPSSSLENWVFGGNWNFLR
jgi:hypothetical protein